MMEMKVVKMRCMKKKAGLSQGRRREASKRNSPILATLYRMMTKRYRMRILGSQARRKTVEITSLKEKLAIRTILPVTRNLKTTQTTTKKTTRETTTWPTPPTIITSC